MKIVLVFLLLSLLVAHSLALKQSYVVYMGAHSHGPEATIEDFDRVTDYHHNFLASFIGSIEEAKDAMIYSYTRHINGFSANMEAHHAAKISEHPSVLSVFLNYGLKKHTTRSWDFMMLENNGVPSFSWYEASFGEDTIIGNLDTGVWPESESFSDYGYRPIPSRWKGTCDHSNFTGAVHCNRKLIGARHFNKGYKAAGGNVSKSMESARDFDGHGTHTLSTAGGNFVPRASFNGIDLGTAKGGSPRARVASYKVCWTPFIAGECMIDDVMAAFDMAIYDGVDVLSLSIGDTGLPFPIDYLSDGIAIGAFHAIQKGITVVCSAGNDGPYEGTVVNIAPWIITVAASTIDRKFQTIVKLGSGLQFKGESISQALPQYKLYPLISGAQAKLPNASAVDANHCEPGTLDSKNVKGKILACLRGNTSILDKGVQAQLVGAAAMILCNGENAGEDIMVDQLLPSAQLSYEDGLAVFKYINSTNEPVAYMTPPTPKHGVKPAPSIADFSSRGPNSLTYNILKPDITAPGVNVVAAYSQAVSPTLEPSDNRRVEFMIESGTSMSCPHISGVAGLLKTLHPTWSPAAIRSAIMTTAKTRDNAASPMMDAHSKEADPFSYGAGHVRPTRAMNPGLVYDITPSDYLDFLCAWGYNETMLETFSNGSHKCPGTERTTALSNLNYPSITFYNVTGTATATRTLKSVGPPGVYVARVRHPAGISVNVEPKLLKFDRIGEEKKFNITLSNLNKTDEHRFGELLWSDGKHYVRSPIVVYYFYGI